MNKIIIRLVLVLILLLSVCGLLAGQNVLAAPGNWLPGWANLSQSSGLNSTDVSRVFEVLGSANRKKIAVTTADGTTQCYVEIEQWISAAQQAWLWVNVPKISNTADTILFLYYDNYQVDNSQMVGDIGSNPGQNVWDPNFVMVQHLNQSAQGISGEYKDSTSRRHDGTGGNVVSLAAPAQIESKIGSGQYFDGVQDFIQVPDSKDFLVTTTGTLTASFWMSASVLNFPRASDSGYINMLGKGDPNRYEWVFTLGNQSSIEKPQEIAAYIHDLSGGLGPGGGTFESYQVNDWIYVVGRFTTSTINLTAHYPNGAIGKDLAKYPTPGGINATPAHGTAPLRIGSWICTDQWYEGRIDELQISNVNRSEAWVNASYYSENDNLVAFGVPGNPPVINPIGDKSVSAGEDLTFVVSASTPNDNPLTYSASNLPFGASFNSATQTFSWIPSDGQIGTYPGIHFEVTVGTLTSFADTAIKVTNPGFGLTGGNAAYAELPNQLQAMRFLNKAGNAILTKLELKFSQGNASGNVHLGVYADDNGKSGTLLLDAGEVAAGTGWVNIISLNLPLAQNTYYWLAFNLQYTNIVEYQDNQETSSHVWGNAAYGSLPAAFPRIEYTHNAQYVMRADISITSIPPSGTTPITSNVSPSVTPPDIGREGNRLIFIVAISVFLVTAITFVVFLYIRRRFDKI